jgi:hypothetical protein
MKILDVIACAGLLFAVSACSSSSKLPDSSALNAQPTPGDSKDGCSSPLGLISEGATARGYLHPVETGGVACQQGELSCTNGQWSGAYIYPSCIQQPR